MRVRNVILSAFAAASLLAADKPLPPAPNKAHLYNLILSSLGVESVLAQLIANDPYLSFELAKVGISDIAAVPLSQELPHAILAWPGQTRYKLMLQDSQAPVPEPITADNGDEVAKQLISLQKAIERLEQSIKQGSRDGQRALGDTQALVMELAYEFRKQFSVAPPIVREPHPYKPAAPVVPAK